MNTSFFITCNRGKLRAYQKNTSGSLENVASVEVLEGTSKISELVTDQAGAFPVSGSMGTSAGESLPLKEELQARSLRTLANKIDEIVTLHKPTWWALAAPSEIHRTLVDYLDEASRSTISVHSKRDLTGIPGNELLSHFETAAASAH